MISTDPSECRSSEHGCQIGIGDTTGYMFLHYELAPFGQEVGGICTSFIFIQQETACDEILNANQKFWESEFENERPGQKQPTLSSPVSWNWCQSSALFSFAAGCTNFTANISSVLEASDTVLCVHCALSESWRHLEALHFSPVDLVH